MSKISKTSAEVPAQAKATEAPVAAVSAVKVIDPRLLIREQGFKGYWTEFKRKVRSGRSARCLSWWA